MGKLFQIEEDDLAQLERDIPAILGRHYSCMYPADKPAFRRIQEIIKNVRWNYGPPNEVHVIPAGPEPDGDEPQLDPTA